MASLPVKSDDRPVSMLELTLNLDNIDFESDEVAAKPSSRVNSMAIKEEEEAADIIPQPVGVHNLESTPMAPVKVVLSMGDNNQQDDKERQQLQERLSESGFSDNLAQDIIKESVQELDPTVYINRMKEECAVYLTILNCTVKVSWK
jgi:hypothetical protein